jgi:hypothetical protein
MCILGLAKRPHTDATTRCTGTVQNQTQKEKMTIMETGYGLQAWPTEHRLKC